MKEVDEERLDLTWPDWAGVGEGQGQAVRGVNGGRRQVHVVSTEYRYEYKDPDVLRVRRSALPTVCLGWLVRSTSERVREPVLSLNKEARIPLGVFSTQPVYSTCRCVGNVHVY